MNDENPFASPEGAAAAATGAPDAANYEYLGFWKRVLASIIDNIIIGIALVPIGLVVVSAISDKQVAKLTDQTIQILIPAIAIVLLWTYFGATPGKMVFGARIVDAKTFQNPSVGQSIGRYLGYIPSTLLLFGGYIMVAFDKKKRALHDVMAGTLVVVPKQRYTRRPARPPRPAEPASRQ